jgi:site-specific recombinase XerD
MKTPRSTIPFSKAIAGYLLAAEARHLSPNTLRDYCTTFQKFQDFLGDDIPIARINAHDVEAFLGSLKLSKKTILNYHVGLSALWTWALAEDLVASHIVQRVERSRPEKRAVVPFTEDDIRALLSVITTTRPYTRPGKRESTHSVPNAERNRAIILLLLDTGIRSSELCGLRVINTDLKNRRIRVMGKGSKERSIPFCARTGQALWRYLQTRKEDRADDFLFTTILGNPLDPDRMLKLLYSIGERAGVTDVHPHRFRHTFAINFLRNGGDPWSLQMMLGHSTMEMVKTYLSIAQADLDKSHKLASPVDNWRL